MPVQRESRSLTTVFQVLGILLLVLAVTASGIGVIWSARGEPGLAAAALLGSGVLILLAFIFFTLDEWAKSKEGQAFEAPRPTRESPPRRPNSP